MGMKARISRSLLDRCGAEAARAAPLEACGLLLGSPGRIMDGVAIPNAAADPRNGFELELRAHIAAARQARSQGMSIIGHYHSHPSGDARPSVRDAAQALEEGVLWLILGNEASLWMARAGGRWLGAFDPVQLAID
jgi:proteasome lid subunit RPN8/RPN11